MTHINATIVAPYNNSGTGCKLSADYPNVLWQDCTGRDMSGGAPSINLMVVEAELSDAERASIEADSSYYIIDAASTGSPLLNWLSSHNFTSHGVTLNDDADTAILTLRQRCRNLGGAVSPGEWTPDNLTLTSYDYWDSTNRAGVLTNLQEPVSPDGDAAAWIVWGVAGQLSVDTLRWRENEMYTVPSRSIEKVQQVVDHGSMENGFIFGTTVSWEGAEDGTRADLLDFVWGADHDWPGAGVKTGDTGIRVTALGSELSVSSLLNDRQPHSVLVHYLPANSEARIYVDGILSGAVSDTGVTFHNMTNLTLIAGNRRGVTNISGWKLIGGVGAATAEDVDGLNNWLLRNVSTAGRP